MQEEVTRINMDMFLLKKGSYKQEMRALEADGSFWVCIHILSGHESRYLLFI